MPAVGQICVPDADTLVLERGPLRVEIALRPFELTVRRGGRRLVRSMGAWVADGTVHDHFIQLTEGVVAAEELAPLERAAAARVQRLAADRVLLAVELNGGRRARLEVRVLADERVSFELEPEGEPLRVAADWRRRSDEHFAGLGARHCTQFDQAGRVVQLGADRRYTGPDCPPDPHRSGLPIIRPLCLLGPADPRGWEIGDAYGYGPALWVAPVLDDEAREREVALPRGEWIESWSGARVSGGGEVVVEAPLERIPVWVRAGSIVVTYPASHVARGLGDVPEGERPLVATLWGAPRLGRAGVRLADGTRISWDRGRWSVAPACSSGRDVDLREIGL
jgi:hypothetical protein